MQTRATPSFDLRRGTASDFEFVKSLHRLTLKTYVEVLWGWDEARQDDMVRTRLDPSRIQIIEVDHNPVGVLSVEHRPEEVFLANLLLAPEHQRVGIGTSIMQRLMDAGRARGVPVTLSVLRPNPALEFYAQLGFTVHGEDEVRFFMKWHP